MHAWYNLQAMEEALYGGASPLLHDLNRVGLVSFIQFMPICVNIIWTVTPSPAEIHVSIVNFWDITTQNDLKDKNAVFA